MLVAVVVSRAPIPTCAICAKSRGGAKRTRSAIVVPVAAVTAHAFVAQVIRAAVGACRGAVVVTVAAVSALLCGGERRERGGQEKQHGGERERRQDRVLPRSAAALT